MLKTEGYENSQLFMALTPKNGVKASKLYSYKPIDGTGDFHWSRNHTAYRLNQEGVLELMGNNVPRVDYTNTCPELLIEKESENLELRSQEFDNVFWIKFNLSVTANTTVAPDGTLTADTITASSGATSKRLVSGNRSAIINNVYTVSRYIKYTNHQWVQLNFTASGAEYANFDILNGIVGNYTTDSANIYPLENGYYRIEITVTSDATANENTQIFFANSGTDGYFPVFDAVGTETFVLWGAQLEESDYATSYIPTTNATQTRPKDVAYNTANGYNDADWSVVMRVRLNNIGSSADEPLLALSDGTTDYYFAIYTDSNPKLHFTWYNNPDQDTYSTNDLSNGIVNVGVSFDSVTAEYIIVIDGTLFDSGTLVNNAPGLFGNFNRLDLGSVAGTGSPDKDGIIGIQYYDSALIQSDLENLTA